MPGFVIKILGHSHCFRDKVMLASWIELPGMGKDCIVISMSRGPLFGWNFFHPLSLRELFSKRVVVHFPEVMNDYRSFFFVLSKLVVKAIDHYGPERWNLKAKVTFGLNLYLAVRLVDPSVEPTAVSNFNRDLSYLCLVWHYLWGL